ncbi:hypothetical protein PVAG01_04247 [Phlyctema vagabunda]|uniref:Rhodopsin domain-containing protein n=1 Tax=Phlyctema vagabunda TaxID=108571 RepID=A0ABR4PNP8_9HELO
MSSTIAATASATLATAIPSGTISALIGQPPATETDYWVVKYLLLAFGLNTDPMKGIAIPPRRPVPYEFETRGPGIIVSMSVAIGFMVLITGLRLGMRLFRRGLLVGLDDVFIVPGVLLAVAWPSLQIVAAKYGGAGKHIYDLTYEEYAIFKTTTNICKPIFFVGVGMIKVSICFFNRRLTSLTGRAWKIYNNVFLALLFVYILVSLFWTIFQCKPAYGGWDPIRIGKEGKKAVCQSDNIVGSALSVIHVIMDFGLLAVPVIVLWKVKMGFRTKARLYLVFTIGGMSVIGSIIRQIEQGRLKSDVTFTFVALQNWTLVDLTFGVAAASLPILSAFIPQKWKSVKGSRQTPGYTGYADKSQKGPYIRSTRRTSISGQRDRTDSEENIVRTDEVELTFQKRNADSKVLDMDSGSAATSFNSTLRSKPSQRELTDRNDLEFGQDGVISKSGHQAWIGEAR